MLDGSPGVFNVRFAGDPAACSADMTERANDMRTFLPPLALLASLILAYSVNAGDIIEDTYPGKQAEVAKAVHDVFRAAARGDTGQLEALHLYGPKFSKFDDIPPSTRQDGAATRENERIALSRLTGFSATVEDLKIDVLGSVAVATFVLRYSFETPDASGSSSARSTMVFVERDGAWRIVHEHFSRLAEVEGAPRSPLLHQCAPRR